MAQQVTAIEGEGGHVTGVRLSDGRVLPCDAALVGVGAQPNDEMAHAAGLDCANGVVVDLEARTSDPSIYAIGDVTWRPLPLYGRPVPPGERAQRAGAGAPRGRRPSAAGRAPAPEVPWFWSDQYDLKLQIAGLTFDPDTVVLRGDMARRRSSPSST